jgi:hypothetical protein
MVGNRRNSYPISDPFSKKQQISKSEYLHTQQSTSTHGIGKSDIMHGVCGAQDIFAERAIFDAWLFCKKYLFQSASSPKGVGSFSISNKIPWTKPSRNLGSFPPVFIFKSSYWTSRPP